MFDLLGQMSKWDEMFCHIKRNPNPEEHATKEEYYLMLCVSKNLDVVMADMERCYDRIGEMSDNSGVDPCYER